MEYDLIKNDELDKQTKIIDEVMTTEGLIILCQNEYARELIDKKYHENPVKYYESYLRLIFDFLRGYKKWYVW